jgi:hypothetical protein
MVDKETQPITARTRKEGLYIMATFLSVTLLDGYGRITTKRFEMTDQVLLVDYVGNANLLLTDLDAITDLQILKASLQIDDGISVPAKDPSGSNVDVGATFVGYVGEADGKKATLKVPGIDLALVGTLGVIDPTQVDVAAFLDLFGDPPNNKFKLSDGEYIEEWITGTLDK